jgi:hypothetical protein
MHRTDTRLTNVPSVARTFDAIHIDTPPSTSTLKAGIVASTRSPPVAGAAAALYRLDRRWPAEYPRQLDQDCEHCRPDAESGLLVALASPRRVEEVSEAGGTPVEIAARVLDVLVALGFAGEGPAITLRTWSPARNPQCPTTEPRDGTDRGQEMGKATRQGRRRNTARSRLSRGSASHRADNRNRRRQAGSRGRSARSAGWAGATRRPADGRRAGFGTLCRSPGQIGSRELSGTSQRAAVSRRTGWPGDRPRLH